MYDYPKFGHPRSNAERKKRHKRLHGNSKLPPRGTGRSESFIAEVLRRQGAK